MKKFIKILFTLLFVLFVTIIAVPYFFKSDIENFIKEEINNNVNAKIDYGDVSLSLLSDFPNLHVAVDNIRIDGIGDFEHIRLAKIDEFTTSLNAKKLFFNEDLEIKKIGINGADIHVVVLKNGKANYDITKPDTIQQVSEEKQNFIIKIEQYKITNSNIIYEDASMGLNMKMKNIQHDGAGEFSAIDYKLSTETSMDTLDIIFDRIHYINDASADLNANILIENDFNKYTINDMLMEINDLGLTSNMMFEMKEDDVVMDITYETKQNSLKKLLSLVPKAYMPDMTGMSANGTASLKGFVKGIYNEKNLPAYGVDFVINKGKIKYVDLPQSVDDINLITKIDFSGGNNLDNTKVDIPRIHFSIAGNSADGRLSVRNPMTDPYIDTQFKSKMDLAKIKQALYLPYIKKLSGKLDADFALKGRTSAIEKQQFNKFDASGYFNLQQMQYATDSLAYEITIDQAKMNIKPQALELNQFDAKVGESDFHVTGKLENYIAYFLQKDKFLKANFKMHSNYLNMNEFMTTEENQENSETTSDTTSMLKVPKNIVVQFKADADHLKYQDMDLNNLKGTIIVKDEKATLETVLLKALGGDMMLKGVYDTSGKVVQSAMDLSMKKVSIPKSAEQLTMFKTYTPIMKKIQGNMFANMNFKVELDEQMNPKLETMDASGLFKTGNLNIGGIDVMKRIGDLLKVNELKQAKVDDIKAQFEINKGKLYVKPFSFKINQIQSGLQGSVTLDEKVNFVLSMSIPRKMLGGKANDILEGLVGQLDRLGLKSDLGEIIKMKFKITGDMMQPKIIPVIAGTEGSSTKEIVTQVVEQKVEELIDDTKEKIKEEARKQADKLLEDAQLQSDKLKSEARKAADKIRLEAAKQAEEIVKKVGNDPFKKIAAEAMAKKLKTEANKKAKQLETEANKKANLIMDNARKKADKLLEEKVKEKNN